MQASDGNFYGTTYTTIYRMTPSGTLTTVYRFCQQLSCQDGDPGGLSIGPDGALYGATLYGTIFKMTLDGTFQVLDQICSTSGGCGLIYSPPIPASDGNLYGTIGSGSRYPRGAIYRITTSGALKVLYAFCSAPDCRDGTNPHGPRFQATDGNLYGTTLGEDGPSVVWRLSMGLPPFVSPLPAYGQPRRQISILGTNLTGATAVTFNGTPAGAFEVNQTGSAITTRVPDGATTGLIEVTLADGTILSSNIPFQVR